MGGWGNEESFSDYTVLYDQWYGSNVLWGHGVQIILEANGL